MSGSMGVITRLKDNEARDAFAEYERWTRERDRKCGLENKDNVPLRELSPSEGCLSDYFDRKTAEVTAAKGDPEKAVRYTAYVARTERRRGRPVRCADPRDTDVR